MSAAAVQTIYVIFDYAIINFWICTARHVWTPCSDLVRTFNAGRVVIDITASGQVAIAYSKSI